MSSAPTIGPMPKDEITPAERKAVAAAKARLAAAKDKREADARAGAARYWDGRRDGKPGRMHL